MKLKKRKNIHSVKKFVLSNVGMTEKQFFSPEMNPYLHGLKEAVAFFKENASLPVTILGDYDADGICATAELYHAFLRLGIVAQTRIPKRFSEGYGFSEKIVEELEAPGLLITVDNGIASIDAIRKAKEKGFKIIVIDHHEPVRDEAGTICLPDADVIIDPKTEELSEYCDYCGAGLAYRFVQELLPDNQLHDLLVLASIATVTDVMTLTGTNHELVRRGLEALNAGYGVPGLKCLIEYSAKKGHFTEEDYGFWFGPIFNAFGRMGDSGASKVLRLLLMPAGDPKMNVYAKQVLEMNDKRKEQSRDQIEFAECLIQDADGSVCRPIVVSDPMFSEGIVGIIAGQLTEKYDCPSIVFTELENGVLKGSGRSIPEVNLKQTLDQMKPLLLGYGGHAGAAGLSIRKEQLEEFRDAFARQVGKLPERGDVVYYDFEIGLEMVPLMIEELKAYAPYGEGNPRPVFRVKLNPSDFKFSRVGDGTSFSMKREKDGVTIAVFGYRMTERYEQEKAKTLDCIVTLGENWYNDKLSYQLELITFQS